MNPTDESGAKFESQFVVPVPQRPIPVQKVKKPTMFPCINCGKLTRSHRMGKEAYMCHGCFLDPTRIDGGKNDAENPRPDDDSSGPRQEEEQKAP